MGAGPTSNGIDAVHTHMTNTLNTPIEILEMYYPLRIKRYQVRTGSGGRGLHKGGNGLIREYEFLQDMTVSILTERRHHSPWGLNGGEPGKVGKNALNGSPLPGKIQIDVKAGDLLSIATAGGGGWGKQI